MLLDLNNQLDKRKGEVYFQKLMEEGAKIELTKKQPRRTGRQNKYIHAIFCIYGMEYGHTEREVKQIIFKKYANPELFQYDFIDPTTGETSKEYKSTAQLDVQQMTKAIERFRNYSAMNGLYLLSSDEYIEQQFHIDKEINKFKEYL